MRAAKEYRARYGQVQRGKKEVRFRVCSSLKSKLICERMEVIEFELSMRIWAVLIGQKKLPGS
jgi:hypothetical protein